MNINDGSVFNQVLQLVIRVIQHAVNSGYEAKWNAVIINVITV